MKQRRADDKALDDLADLLAYRHREVGRSEIAPHIVNVFFHNRRVSPWTRGEIVRRTTFKLRPALDK